MKYIVTNPIFFALVTIAIAYDDLPNSAGFYESLLNNDSAINALFGCLLEKNPCDEFGAHVKGHILESLSDNCNECDAIQKHYGHLFDKIVTDEKHKGIYEEFKAKYDPEGKLITKFEESLKGY